MWYNELLTVSIIPATFCKHARQIYVQYKYQRSLKLIIYWDGEITIIALSKPSHLLTVNPWPLDDDTWWVYLRKAGLLMIELLVIPRRVLRNYPSETSRNKWDYEIGHLFLDEFERHQAITRTNVD